MITSKKRSECFMPNGMVERKKIDKKPKVKELKEPRERKTRNPYDLRSHDALDYAVSMYSEIK